MGENLNVHRIVEPVSNIVCCRQELLLHATLLHSDHEHGAVPESLSTW